MVYSDLNYLDLFSGIGGFAEGLEMAGFSFKNHFFSDIDKHAVANYKYNFKNAQHVGDIRTISSRTITDRPDIVTFGFPCQDLSVAGKGKGLSGHRSGLFYEAVRLIEELKPPVFIFENVKGLLSSNKGKDFELVLRTIADIGLYVGEWQLLNTAWFLPQNRERVYFVGHLAGRSRPRVFPIGESNGRAIERQSETASVRTITAGGNSGGHHSGMTLIKRTDTDGNDRPQGDRIYESSGISPALSSQIGNASNGSVLIQQKGRGFNKGGKHYICPTISSHAFQNNNFVKNQIITHYGHKNKDATEHEICPTLKAQSHGHEPMVKRQPLKFLNRNQKNYDGDYAYTIDSSNTGGVNINGEIRRLTEIECERLQGFPDDWTKFGDYNGTIKQISRTQRYKMIGNAVTTLVVQKIGNNLIQP